MGTGMSATSCDYCEMTVRGEETRRPSCCCLWRNFRNAVVCFFVFFLSSVIYSMFSFKDVGSTVDASCSDTQIREYAKMQKYKNQKRLELECYFYITKFKVTCFFLSFWNLKDKFAQLWRFSHMLMESPKKFCTVHIFGDWGRWGLVLKCEKATGKNTKRLQTAHLLKSSDPKMIWYDCIYILDTWLCPCTWGVHANTLSSVATGNILAKKNRYKLHLFSGLGLCQTSCVGPFFCCFYGLFFTFYYMSPSTSVEEHYNAVLLWTFCRLQNATCLSISIRVRRSWLNFHFCKTLSFYQLIHEDRWVFQTVEKANYKSWASCLILIVNKKPLQRQVITSNMLQENKIIIGKFHQNIVICHQSQWALI